MFGASIANSNGRERSRMSLAHDVELARQKMLQAQEALLRYAEANVRDGERHKGLVQELKNATKDFVDCVERLAGRASADERTEGDHPEKILL
jgi:hypothetical protein